jgi:hypothetical protein
MALLFMPRIIINNNENSLIILKKKLKSKQFLSFDIIKFKNGY